MTDYILRVSKYYEWDEYSKVYVHNPKKKEEEGYHAKGTKA